MNNSQSLSPEILGRNGHQYEVGCQECSRAEYDLRYVAEKYPQVIVEEYNVQDEAARKQGARYAVRQASPRMLQLLQQRGWRILGRSAPDDRFPGVAFQTVIKYF